MITVKEANKKSYERNLREHDCGYWGVCDDKACPCSIDKNVDGFDNEVYQKMKIDLQKQVENYDW